MLLVYRSGLIKVNDKFRLGVVAATGGIALFYLAQFRAQLLRHLVPRHQQRHRPSASDSACWWWASQRSTWCSTSISSSKARSYNAPKYMEWYSAFALMVTLVWLYLEMLRLLTKFRSRN